MKQFNSLEDVPLNYNISAWIVSFERYTLNNNYIVSYTLKNSILCKKMGEDHPHNGSYLGDIWVDTNNHGQRVRGAIKLTEKEAEEYAKEQIKESYSKFKRDTAYIDNLFKESGVTLD